MIDLFEEMRAVELDERLATQQRGHWAAGELLDAATRHESLGWADEAGAIAVGRRADLVTVATDHVRTAGTGADEQTAVFAAVAEDVTHVVADGRVVFRGRRPRTARPRPGRRDRETVAMSTTLITDIGELVTNDPDADDLLGDRPDAAHRRRRAPPSPGWAGPRTRRRRTSRSTPADVP